MALKTITPEYKDFREASIYIRLDSTPSVVRSPANTEQTAREEPTGAGWTSTDSQPARSTRQVTWGQRNSQVSLGQEERGPCVH